MSFPDSHLSSSLGIGQDTGLRTHPPTGHFHMFIVQIQKHKNNKSSAVCWTSGLILVPTVALSIKSCHLMSDQICDVVYLFFDQIVPDCNQHFLSFSHEKLFRQHVTLVSQYCGQSWLSFTASALSTHLWSLHHFYMKTLTVCLCVCVSLPVVPKRITSLMVMSWSPRASEVSRSTGLGE